MSLGGLLLDLVAPRPKPRVGSEPADPRTPARDRLERHVAAPAVSVIR
jgi:hypothetical protein